MNTIPGNFQWDEWAPEQEHAKVIRPSEIVDEVIDSFYGDVSLSGALFPWDKTTLKGLRIGHSEVTLYAGINGHRKSMFTTQLCAGLMNQGEPCLIASFEMRPKQTMNRMIRMASGTDNPSIEYIKAFHKWTDGKLWIYDHHGMCKPNQVAAVTRYAGESLAVRHVFIDSLMKCTTKTDDYSEQKQFVGQLCAMGMEYGHHTHLIAHARKGPGSEFERIGKFAVRGAGEIADQVDNLVLIQKTHADDEPAKTDEEGVPMCDMTVEFAKNRNGGYEGTLGFWWNPKALTFVERPNGNWHGIKLGGLHGEQ